MNQTHSVCKQENGAANMQLFQSNKILSSDHTYKQVLVKMLRRNGDKKKHRRNHVLNFMLQFVPKYSTA